MRLGGQFWCIEDAKAGSWRWKFEFVVLASGMRHADVLGI